MTFEDELLLKQGLEYSVKLPCGHVVRYLSKDTAEAYRDNRQAEIIPPHQGPDIPDVFEGRKRG